MRPKKQDMKIDNEFFMSMIQIELMINSLMMNQLENMSLWIGLRANWLLTWKSQILNRRLPKEKNSSKILLNHFASYRELVSQNFLSLTGHFVGQSHFFKETALIQYHPSNSHSTFENSLKKYCRTNYGWKIQKLIED